MGSIKISHQNLPLQYWSNPSWQLFIQTLFAWGAGPLALSVDFTPALDLRAGISAGVFHATVKEQSSGAGIGLRPTEEMLHG